MSADTPHIPMADSSLPLAAEFSFHRRVHGPADTTRLGEEAAGLLCGGEIILLYGDLGAGKTCFTQGLCRGLAVDLKVVSPTFTLVNTYSGRLVVHHLDFYRVEPEADLTDIGIPDILDQVADGGAVAVVEWPALLARQLGMDIPRLEMMATIGPAAEDRTWHLRGVPTVPEPWVDLFTDGDSPPLSGV
jgi:tRNA threonylcarbamoyladenosine biosynthesis protein TsaE